MGLASFLTRSRKRKMFLAANTLFLGLGLTSLAVGVWLYLEKNDFLELTPSSFSALSAAGLCAFSGAAIAIISAVGCISITLHGRCLLITYICFICLLILIQLVTGLTGFLYKESTREKIRHDLLININRSIAMTRAGRTIHLRISWDHLHESLECCGVDGPQDWYKTMHWKKSDYVPDSCCDPSYFNDDKEGMSNCGKITTNFDKWYHQGCYGVFADWLYHHIHIVSTLSIVLIGVEAIVLSFGFLVCCDGGGRMVGGRSRTNSYRYEKGTGDDEDTLTAVQNH